VLARGGANGVQRSWRVRATNRMPFYSGDMHGGVGGFAAK
jgi:hypothetical protein